MSHGRELTCNRGRMVGVLSVVLTVFLSAIGTWFYGADTVRAPEPAKLNSTLRARAPPASTTVIYMRSSWTLSNAKVGQPCTTTWPLVAGTKPTKVIRAMGNYRKCL